MAVITLSWQFGCLGDIIATEAAKQLDYQIIGKHAVNDMLTKLTGQSSKELETNNALSTAEEEIESGVFQRLRRQQATYANLLISAIYQAASQNNTIIKGYGAQRFLFNQPHVLCVRLKGSFNARVAMIEQHRQIEHKTACDLVRKEDRERVEFIQYVFKRELTDVKWYDMIIDIEKIGFPAITDLIITTARSLDEIHPMTDAERETLEGQALAYRITALVQKRYPSIDQFDVKFERGGIVTISGTVKDEEKKNVIPQHILVLPEVSDVVNNLEVVTPSRRGH